MHWRPHLELPQPPALSTAGLPANGRLTAAALGDKLGQVDRRPPLTLRAERIEAVLVVEQGGVGVEGGHLAMVTGFAPAGLASAAARRVRRDDGWETWVLLPRQPQYIETKSSPRYHLFCSQQTARKRPLQRGLFAFWRGFLPPHVIRW